MCGIVGVAGDFSRDECLRIVQTMNDVIVHRGPDDQGTWAEDGFGFGMRRLSIIDLAGGHQPIWDDPSGLGIVFNGEIYNYKSLRDRLEREGHSRWTSNSDTEVLLKSFALAGEEAIHDWNGMFGVALWDSLQKRLTLIRDRLGVKPLYYSWDGKTLVFASEIKAILASGLVEKRLSRQAVWDYLTFRYVPGPETIWEGIRKLPPGHLLEFARGSEPQERCYWKTDVCQSDGGKFDQERVDREFAELFLDAVNLRLVASDVPVGVFLSGGLDSSAIAAAAVELGHRNFHTFSVGFAEGGLYSELPYARRVAEHVGAQYHEVVVDREQFLEMLPQVVYYSDEPLADLTLVPLLSVSRLARECVKVVLSGEGSDEVLAGYNLDEMEREWQMIGSVQRLPRLMLSTGTQLANVALPEKFARRARRVSEVPLKDWNQQTRPHMTRYWAQDEKQRLWPDEAGEDSERILAAQYAHARSGDPLQQLLSVYQKSWLVEDLLMKADKMSMATSLEARTPFLDYRLVEWANRQPNGVKVKNVGFRQYRTKDVLRRFCESRLPAEILQREKRGFPVPAYTWLQEGLEPWVRERLLDRESRVTAAFDRQEISRLITQAAAGAGDAAHRVWMLVILEYWLEAWGVNLV